MRRCLKCRDIIGSEHRFREVKCHCGNLTVSGGGYSEKERSSSIFIDPEYYYDKNTTIEDLRNQFKDEEDLCLAICLWAHNSMNMDKEEME